MRFAVAFRLIDNSGVALRRVLASPERSSRASACVAFRPLLRFVQPSTPRDVPARLAERDSPGAEVDRHVSLGVEDSAGARAPTPPATRHPDPAMTVEGLNDLPTDLVNG